MKTLLLNGSPHPNGETAALIEVLCGLLPGERCVVDAYTAAVRPCADCRFCRTNPGCCIPDEMQSIYTAIREADAIVIASPIYFSELTGPLLSLLSRLQMFYCMRTFQGANPFPKAKRGGILLTGGGDGSFSRAASTAKILLHQMGAAECAEPVVFHETNRRSARTDVPTQRAVAELAVFLSTLECSIDAEK